MHDQSTRLERERDATLIRLSDKLGKLEDYVSGTVESVTDSVQSVRDSVDLKLQMRRRPWRLVAGVVALGFLGGYRSRQRESRDTMQNGLASAVPRNLAPPSAKQGLRPLHKGNGVAAARPLAEAATQWAKNMANSSNPDVAKLKTLAVGMIAGLARDALIKHASRSEKSSAGFRGDNGR